MIVIVEEGKVLDVAWFVADNLIDYYNLEFSNGAYFMVDCS